MESEKGFTLLEVLLVIVVLGLVLAIAWPAGQIHNYSQLRVWTRSIVSDLRWAQFRAINDNEKQYIDFDLEDNSYQIYVIEEGQKKVVRKRVVEPKVKIVKMSISPSIFHFTPSGAPSLGNTITLAAQSRKALIYIRVGTGRIRVDYE